MTEELKRGDVERILNFLRVNRSRPDLALLDALVSSYIQSVPWESASRIVRRVEVSETGSCPRWPEEFWRLAMTRGLGGTCFESNYAFFALLKALGYTGYLTINNMGETIGCHTAIVLNINDEQWLADVGIPVHAPVQLDPQAVTRRDTPYLRYSARPDGANTYQIERAPHPKSNVFTLLDAPVSDAVYRAAVAADYEPTGYFNDAIVINKVIGGQVWRFSSRDLPLHLETFKDSQRFDTPLDGDTEQVGRVVADKFGMDEEIVVRALKQVT